MTGILNANWMKNREECSIIGIYHACEGGIEKSVPRITDWHCEGPIFLSHPCTNNGFFSCSPSNTAFILFKERLTEVPEYVVM